MTPAEEQQLLVSLAEISKDIKSLLALISALTMQQEKADSRAFQQLATIAHKR